MQEANADPGRQEGLLIDPVMNSNAELSMAADQALLVLQWEGRSGRVSTQMTA